MNGPPYIPPVQQSTQQQLEIVHKSVVNQSYLTLKLFIFKFKIDMFFELDLTQTIRNYGHLNSAALASVILDTIQNIPRKRGPVFY
jgi:hypothetical protein